MYDYFERIKIGLWELTKFLGLCDACLLRKKGFDEANLDDG